MNECWRSWITTSAKTKISSPFGRPLNSDDVLNWTRAINPASSITVKWLIRFITTTTFELHQDDVFDAVYSTDVLVSKTEMNFTVNGAHGRPGPSNWVILVQNQIKTI